MRTTNLPSPMPRAAHLISMWKGSTIDAFPALARFDLMRDKKDERSQQRKNLRNLAAS